MLDLVEGGAKWDEVVYLAKEIEKAGATLINTGTIGTRPAFPISTSVPRGVYLDNRTHEKRGEYSCITTNRINTPEVAESVLAQGRTDMVSIARLSWLTHFVAKAMRNESKLINTCIACNQACLTMRLNKKATRCLVNPQACYETELTFTPQNKKKLAVVGAGQLDWHFNVCCWAGTILYLFDKAVKLAVNSIMPSKFGKRRFYEAPLFWQSASSRWRYGSP